MNTVFMGRPFHKGGQGSEPLDEIHKNHPIKEVQVNAMLVKEEKHHKDLAGTV